MNQREVEKLREPGKDNVTATLYKDDVEIMSRPFTIEHEAWAYGENWLMLNRERHTYKLTPEPVDAQTSQGLGASVEDWEVKNIERFFYEHPLHAFPSRKIAEYLNMEIEKVELIIKQIGDFVEPCWRQKNLDYNKPPKTDNKPVTINNGGVQDEIDR